MSQEEYFKLANITVKFADAVALSNVSLQISEGEKVAIIGPSGAGKTTLLNVLNGMQQAFGVSVDGEDLSKLDQGKLRKIRAKIGFVHQDFDLIPNVRVLHNVMLGALSRYGFFTSVKNFFLPQKDDLLKIHELLELVGIADKLYMYTSTLSRGQQQRVAIARALFQNPGALLADEPVSSLDPARAREVLKLFCELSDRLNLTFCASMHSVELAREFFPRIVAFKEGHLVFDSPSDKVSDDMLEKLYEIS